jgi:DNA-binding LacI/PurR family transcriptional regulator
VAPVTQKELANRLGVSRSLVSMALSDSPLVAEETRYRIKAAAAELGYVRDIAAANLAIGRSTIVGVLLPDLRNPFFEGVVDALQRHAAANGLLALVATGANDRERERGVIERFQELRAAGLVAVSPAASRRQLQSYAKQLPVVTIGTLPVGGLVDVVHVDEPAAAALIVSRVRELDIPNLVHLALAPPGRHDDTVAVRRDAIAQAAATALGFRAYGTIEETLAFVRAEVKAGRRVAVSVHNDVTAVNLTSALRGAGLAVGSDVAVFGFDDTPLAALSEFDLTSLAQGSEALGRTAVELLLDHLANPDRKGREVVVKPHLSIRSSG